IASSASFASSALSYFTKPKPRDRPTQPKMEAVPFSMVPYFPKAAARVSSFVSKLRPPMKSFPSSDIL
ncbi:hypothetical protein NQD34_012662, partial [Periophthalmus magnuspinnatus]